MSRNGSGIYVLPSGNPVITGGVVSSTWANSTLNDIASALTGSISADGQTTPTGALTMGGFNHTNVGNANLRTQYSSAGQVQDSTAQYLTSVSGSNVVIGTASLGMSAYVAGQVFRFIASATNTSNVTLNINSIGAVAVTKNGTVALAAGDIIINSITTVVYDGTQFQLSSSVSLLSSDNTWTGTNSFNNNILMTGTGGIKVPSGTTAQRPTGLTGFIRYNTTLARYEVSLTGTGAVINTLTYVTTTATCTTVTNHNLSTGDYVVIAGASMAAYNGGFNIVVTGATTFTYTMASNPGANGTGASYTYAQWVAVGGANGGGSDQVFFVNSQTVTTSYTLPSGTSASSTGPITLNSGVTVTIPSGGRWVVL
jgi:hypothetical protein